MLLVLLRVQPEGELHVKGATLAKLTTGRGAAAEQRREQMKSRTACPACACRSLLFPLLLIGSPWWAQAEAQVGCHFQVMGRQCSTWQALNVAHVSRHRVRAACVSEQV